ncbi:MAG: response regulator [Thermoleophilia bacterium]
MSGAEKTKIVVVDDNADVRRLVKKVLERAGYLVVEAASGEEALSTVEALVPDLVLMDIRLPGAIDGLEAAERMRKDARLARTPIVALTASVFAEDRDRALAAGCAGFIAKPVDITSLPGLVEKFIARGAAGGR